MKRKKAILLLNEQKRKLLDQDIYKDEAWVFQTASHIKAFFGGESVEFSFISQFSFSVKIHSGASSEQTQGAIKYQKDLVLTFLNNCIQTIEQRGLYRPESKFKKWITEPENWWKILTFIVVSAISAASIIYAVKK